MAHPWDVGDNVVQSSLRLPRSRDDHSCCLGRFPVVKEMDASGTTLQTYDGTNGCYRPLPTS